MLTSTPCVFGRCPLCPVRLRCRHLESLLKSADALRFEGIPSTENVTVAIFSALAANDMRDGVHVHVTLTRGTKTTCRMNPNFNVFG